MSKTAAMFGAAGALLLAIAVLIAIPFFFHKPFYADLADDTKEREVIQKLVEEKQYDLAAQQAMAVSRAKELSFFTREEIGKILKAYPQSRKDFEKNQTALLQELKTIQRPNGIKARTERSLLVNNFLDLEEVLGKTEKETTAAIAELYQFNPDLVLDMDMWQRVVDAEEYDMAKKLMNDGDYAAFAQKIMQRQNFAPRTLKSQTVVIQDFSENINKIIKVAVHFNDDRSAAKVYKMASDFLTENGCPTKFLEKPAAVPDAEPHPNAL